MKATAESIMQLRKKAEDARTEANRASGALDNTMARLRTEFGVDSIEKAEKLLEEMTATQAEQQTAFDKAVADFEQKWAERL